MTYAQARLAAIRARKAAEKTQTITPVVGSQRVAIKSTFPMATEANAPPYMKTRNAIVNAHREQNQTNTPSTLENTSMFDLNTMTVHIFPVTKSEIRAITDERGEPWFMAADVAKILGYSETSAMLRRLDDDEKNSLRFSQVNRGNPYVTIISEAGVYEAIFGSNRPESKEFKRWVKREVLPSIRKTGAYSMQPTPVIPATYTEALRLALAQAEELERKQAALDYAAPRCREAQPTALPCVHL